MVKKDERIMFSKDIGKNLMKGDGKKTTFRASLRELKNFYLFKAL